MCEQENLLEQKYICIAKELSVDGELFRIIICMTPVMSQYVMKAKQLTIDTSFKRVYDMEEFEMETWHDNGKKCRYIKVSSMLC